MNPEEKSFLSLRTLPARLNPEQTAWYLGCKVDAVTVLIAAGLLKPLGRPSQTAVKFFSLAELEALRADTKWLSRTTEAIQSWHRRKNGRPVMTASPPRGHCGRSFNETGGQIKPPANRFQNSRPSGSENAPAALKEDTGEACTRTTSADLQPRTKPAR
jgi:hypothetical protein